MRLTAELIEKSASFINAVRDRELDLRSMIDFRHWGIVTHCFLLFLLP